MYLNQNSNKNYFSKILLLISLLAVIYIVMLTVYYVSAEHNIYSWDFRGYWESWRDFGHQLHENLYEAQKKLFRSVRKDNYNLIPILLLTPFSVLGYTSRLIYILLINVLYYVPLVFFLYYFFKHYQEKTNVYWILAIILCTVSFPPFWITTLRGFPDIIGLPPIVASLIFIKKLDLGIQINWKKALTLGLLLWLPFLFRKWYAYTVVSLYLSLPLLNIAIHYKNKGIDLKKRIVNVFLNFFVAGLFSLLFVLLLQSGMLIKLLLSTSHYMTLYIPYNFGFRASLLKLKSVYGLYLLPLVLFALWSIFSAKVKRLEKIIVLFSLFNFIFSFLLFARTQTPDIQHTLPWSLWYFIIVGFGFKWLLDLLVHKKHKMAISGLVVLWMLFVNQLTLFPYAIQNKNIDSILPEKSYPLRKNNLQPYLSIMRDIRQLAEGGKTATAFIASWDFNDDMLLSLSDNILIDHLYLSPKIDTSPIEILPFTASYMLVTDPIQTQLAKKYQQSLIIPVKSVLNHSTIGKAYQLFKGPYVIDDIGDGVRAYIYKKERIFTDQETEAFLDKFYLLYPSWKKVFNHFLAKKLLGSIIDVNNVKNTLDINQDETLKFKSCLPTDMKVRWNLGDSGILRLHGKYDEENHVDFNFSQGTLSKNFSLKNGEVHDVDLHEFQNGESIMTIHKANKGCLKVIFSYSSDK